MSKNVFVFCLLLSNFFYPLEKFCTFYNMQSVSSNAVANYVDTIFSQTGNWIYIPSPSNVTTYVKIGIEYNKGYITPLVIAQAYTQTYILSETSKAKSISGGQYGLNGISWTAYNVDTNKYFWLRIVGWWQIILFSTHKLSILQRTTTAPSGITFTSPT